MAYGTALASFNVEAFGIERMPTLTSDEIAERVAELQRITRSIEKPIALRLNPPSAQSDHPRVAMGSIARRDLGISVVDAGAEDADRRADLHRLVGDQAGAGREPVRDDDGGIKRQRPHPRKPFPRRPRRGPHGDPAPQPPARVRTVAPARARSVTAEPAALARLAHE